VHFGVGFPLHSVPLSCLAGEWKEDKRHGKGTVTYRGQDGSIVEKFEGDWYEGKMHGHGRYVYADGGVYQGQW